MVRRLGHEGIRLQGEVAKQILIWINEKFDYDHYTSGKL